MWSFMGDLSKYSSGTYYYPSNEHIAFFWNMYDQVLISPSLIEYFNDTELQILDHDGITSLLTCNKLPNKKLYSDHLPIIFSIHNL